MTRSIAADFSNLVQKHPGKVAIINKLSQGPHVFTYQQFDAIAKRINAFYQAHQLQPQDIILSLLPNSLEKFAVFFATVYGGYGFNPVHPDISPTELENWLQVVRPKLTIIPDNLSEENRQVLKKHQHTIVPITVDGSLSWLPSQGEGVIHAQGQPKLYLTTSGTTGRPKALVLDTNKVWASGYAFMEFHQCIDPSLRFWNFLPMTHLSGLFNLGLIPLSIGGSMVIDKPFDGRTFLDFWDTVQEHDINALWFVPSIIQGLIKLGPRVSPDKLAAIAQTVKVCFLGMAPATLASKTEFESLFGLALRDNFALTETTFFATETLANTSRRVEGSVGEIIPYTDVKIIDKEICVKSPYLFLGYLQADGALNQSLDKDGYFHTGDLGFLTEDGMLVINGRERDFIKKGGYFIALREIEVLMENHPLVEAAAAVKINHEFYGESYKLFIILRDPSAAGEQAQVKATLLKILTKTKWPEQIIFSTTFPKTASGKIQKHKLIESPVAK